MRRWLGRPRLAAGFAAFLAAWYLGQHAVVAAFGREAAIHWFYFTTEPSPGVLLAPVSHNIDDPGHLRRNVVLLALARGVAEPHLQRRTYAALLFGLSFVSVVAANTLSVVFGTMWVLAGASGGVYGLWAFIGVRNRGALRDIGGPREAVEPTLVLGGLLTVVFVPIFDVYTTGALNTGHLAGIVLGCGLGLVEKPPDVGW